MRIHEFPLSHTNITTLTESVSVVFQVSDCHVEFTRDSEEWREDIIRKDKNRSGVHDITPYRHHFWQLKAFFSRCSRVSQTAQCMTICVYAICCRFLKRPKLWKRWPFQRLSFMHVYLPQLCLLTDTDAADKVSTETVSLRFVSFLTSLVVGFFFVFFLHQRLETDLSYWMDQARSTDQGRQHHFDENSPIGPRDPSSYRHGANVNYDYY